MLKFNNLQCILHDKSIKKTQYAKNKPRDKNHDGFHSFRFLVKTDGFNYKNYSKQFRTLFVDNKVDRSEL